MTGMTVSAGVSSVAHGVHYTVLGLGLLGLVALLAPQRRSPRTAPDAERVERLRAAAASGTLASPLLPGGSVAVLAAPAPRLHRPEKPLLLPLAVVSAAGAAGVHAAVGPAHFSEAAVLGLFFALAATAQLGWAAWVALCPSARAIALGATGNAALIVLWLVSRTTGVPGVQSGRERVGPWDLTCVALELVVVLSCLRLRRTGTSRLARWDRWHPAARWWTLASALALVALSISGASS